MFLSFIATVPQLCCIEVGVTIMHHNHFFSSSGMEEGIVHFLYARTSLSH